MFRNQLKNWKNLKTSFLNWFVLIIEVILFKAHKPSTAKISSDLTESRLRKVTPAFLSRVNCTNNVVEFWNKLQLQIKKIYI
jgi:hypothetical protein